MKYEALRAQIKSGDLLAWSHRGWRTWYDFKVQMVRVFERSEYTHVGIAWRSGGRVWVIESVTPLVRVVPLSTLLPCYVAPMPVRWNQGVEAYALSFVGDERWKYSEWEAIKAWFGKHDTSNRWLECAEYVKMVYDRMGLDLRGRATPSDVVLAAQQAGAALSFLDR